MPHVLAKEIDEAIIPAPGKEAGVFNALDALYFEEQYPCNDITNDMILEKRRELEGRAGDRSGLKQMKMKWCKRHKVNPYNDPNAAKKPSNRQAADPLQKITAGLYSQIEAAVRAEHASEVEALKKEVITLSESNEELTNKLAHTAKELTTQKNEKQLMLDKLKIAERGKIAAETIAAETNNKLKQYIENIEEAINQTVNAIETSYKLRAEQYDLQLEKLSQELTNARKQYAEDIDEARCYAERIRHEYMGTNYNLELKVQRLELTIAKLEDEKKILSKEVIHVREMLNERLEDIAEKNDEKLAIAKKIDASICETQALILNQAADFASKLEALTGISDIAEKVEKIDVRLKKKLKS